MCVCVCVWWGGGIGVVEQYLESIVSQMVYVIMLVIHQGMLPHTEQLFHCIQGEFQLTAKILYHY